MNNLISNQIKGSFGLAILMLSACATAPPKELVDARAAYEKARTGQAAQLKPALVHNAKNALDTAEKAFSDDANTEETQDLAYIAARKAQLAEAAAGAAAAEAKSKRALDEGQNLQTKMLDQTGTKLAQSEQALAVEKQRSLDSERRSKEAFDKLTSQMLVKEDPRGTVITLPGNTFFESGKSELLPGSQDKLFQVADALKDQDNRRILVEGHTDSRGGESYNMALSQRRAESVRQLLVSRGVPTEQIQATGMGPSRPAANNKSAEGRANNRRVEIIVQGPAQGN